MVPEANIQPSQTSCCTGTPGVQTCPGGIIIEDCCDESTCQWQPMPCPSTPTQSVAPSVSETIPSPAIESEPSPSSESVPSPSSESQPSPAIESEPSPSSETEPSPSSETEPSPSMENEPMSEPCDEEPEPSPSSENQPSPSNETEPIPPLPVITVEPCIPNEESPEPSVNTQPEPSVNTQPEPSINTQPSSTPASTPTATPVSAPVPIIANPCDNKCTGYASCPSAQCRMVTVTKVIPGASSPASTNCGSSGTIVASGTVTDTPSGITGDGTISIDQDINKLGTITKTPSGYSGSFNFDEPVSASGTITDTPSGIVASGTITAEEPTSPCNSTSENNSTVVIVNECQWVCPSFCSTWCSSYECPTGTSLVSCGARPNELYSCYPICAAQECNSSYANENTTECANGQVEIWNYSNGSCSRTCSSNTCDDPCSPNCVPICSLGGSRPPCLSSTCTYFNPGGPLIPVGGSLSLTAILSGCSWTPSVNSYNCVSEVTNQCYGNPICPTATCETDANGNNYWDNTVCNKDCTSFNQSQCPGSYDCSGGPGVCTLIGDNCTWMCPINPCQNSTGSPLCQSPAPVGPPFDGCLSWKARCIVSNVTAFPAVCGWDVQCTTVSQNLSGPCNISDCGSQPNTSCPGSETWACARPSGVGLCQWAYSCPPNLNLSTPCSQEECNTLYLVKTRNTSVCGINPTAKPVCVRNCKGICEDMTPCYPVYQPPTCQRSPCGNVCYDPRWLTGEQIAPDSFNASLVNIPSSNCSLCLKRCSGFLWCGRPSSNPICQFSHSDAYDKCVSNCTARPILSPPSVNQTSQCFGRDPCKCNYSICTFVTVVYSSGNLYAECLSNAKANQASSLPGYKVLYSSVAPPTYCQSLQNSSSNSNSSLDNFLNRANNCTSDQLQQNLLNSLSNMTNSTSNFTDYIPQISAVLVPSVNTTNNSSSSNTNSSIPSSSNNNTNVNVGCVVSFYGDKPPSNSTLSNWCQLILQQSIATAMQISPSQLGICNLVLAGSSSSSSLYSKRSIQQDTGFSGTYILTSTVAINPNQNSPLSSPPPQTITATNSPSSSSTSLMCSVVLLAILVVLVVF